MKNLVLVLLLAAAPFWSAAQKKDKAVEKLGKTITAADLQRHLYIIAGPEMEGRNTPSPGLEKAAVYIENHFKSLEIAPGNEGSYRQFYPLYKDSVIGSSFSVNGEALVDGRDYIPGVYNYTSELFLSEVVFVGYGIVEENVRDDYKGLNVAGKLVLYLDGVPEGYKPAQQGRFSPASPMAKLRAAQQKGAIGALVAVPSVAPRASGSGGYSLNRNAGMQMPLSFSIANTVAEKILGTSIAAALVKHAEGKPENAISRAKIDLAFQKTSVTEKVSNVLGIIEGTDKKDEYVIITAHYDHDGIKNGEIYYGADDDGSGTVAILELAEAFAAAKKAGKGPRRTIVFMPVSGEEKGLWGSAYYSENPVFPLEKTTANLNIDMIGRVGEEYLKSIKDSGNYVYVIGDDRLSTDLEPIQNSANRYLNLKLDRRYNGDDPNRFYFRSDHYNFARKGVPAIFYFNGVHPDYHRPSDTPDKINYKLLEKRAQLVFYTAWELANREEMVTRDLELKLPGR